MVLVSINLILLKAPGDFWFQDFQEKRYFKNISNVI